MFRLHVEGERAVLEGTVAQVAQVLVQPFLQAEDLDLLQGRVVQRVADLHTWWRRSHVRPSTSSPACGESLKTQAGIGLDDMSIRLPIDQQSALRDELLSHIMVNLQFDKTVNESRKISAVKT